MSGGSDRASLADAVHRRLLATPPEDDTQGSPADRRDTLRALVRDEAPLLGGGGLDEVVAGLEARVSGLGRLQELLDGPEVTEIMVNGGGEVWVERDGELAPTGLVLDERETLQAIERVLAPLGLHVDRARPMVDARLDDGSRVNAVIRPLAVDGPCLTIRRFRARAVTLDEFASAGVVSVLRWAVRERANLVVSGGTGAGKTTLLNALGVEIGSDERVITIEDAAELRLPGRHVIRLEARPANSEGAGEVRVRDLVRNALRMRPDRLVVGEVRGGEALDMVLAMNTGHDGSLSTCHANGPLDALRRVETLALMAEVDLPHGAIREQVTAAVDLVVHVSRTWGGPRSVTAVGEVASGGEGTFAVRDLVRDGRLVALPTRSRGGPGGEPDPSWLEAVP